MNIAEHSVLYPKTVAELPNPIDHEWTHGDVFRNNIGTSMIFLNAKKLGQQIFCAGCCHGDHSVEEQREFLMGATFLFNIYDMATNIMERTHA